MGQDGGMDQVLFIANASKCGTVFKIEVGVPCFRSSGFNCASSAACHAFSPLFTMSVKSFSATLFTYLFHKQKTLVENDEKKQQICCFFIVSSHTFMHQSQKYLAF
jgi:hypothetical protein